MNNRDKRVLVGMSGGIDSSATCIMLQEQGYEVVGVTMRTWDVPSRFSTPGQDEPDDVLEAKALAERLGIEHHVADVRKEFKQIIVKHFIDEYMQGRNSPILVSFAIRVFKRAKFSVNGRTKRIVLISLPGIIADWKNGRENCIS